VKAIGNANHYLQNQLEEQRCGWIAGLPVRPYLHHNNINTALIAPSVIGFQRRSAA
jgi:hypothetical protein